MTDTADVVVCGAGIAGLAAAYHLSVRQRIGRVLIVDELPPMSLTSDKGTQGYRNWWPGPDNTMFRFVSRSIDLLEETAHESGNVFRLNRRGYLFATSNETELTRLEATARQVAAFGMGDVRVHRSLASYAPAPAEGFADQPIGADLLIGDAARTAFPYLSSTMVGALHVRRAGFMSGVNLGAWFLARAAAAGATFVRDKVAGVRTSGGRVSEVVLASGARVATERFVIAAGPALPRVAGLLGVALPVFHELHAKVAFRDRGGAIRRDAPFLIWNDPLHIDWSDNERLQFGEQRDFPGGVHIRPMDLTHGDELYLIWTFETDRREYEWPPHFDRRYAEIVLRGCAQMAPAMAPYLAGDSRGVTDGGYYCKTPENRPLVGPLAVDGAFVIGALSGYGLMSAHGAGELVAADVVGGSLPDYAKWFLPSRYEDPAYQQRVAEWGPLVGQL
jgi:glycine/D-amino acid oxidase-like deaminating enzyme